MIRQAIIRQICEEIDLHNFFKCNDFELQASEEQNALLIQYRYDVNIWFRVTIEKGEIYCTRRPGTLTTEGGSQLNNRQQLVSAIADWLEAVSEEIHTGPIQREMAKQREQIEELIGQFGNAPDEFFSQEERELASNKLADLEDRLSAHLKEHAAERGSLKEQLDELHDDFNTLRDQLESLKKPNWVRCLVVRATTWLKDPLNRELLKDGGDLVKGFLESQNTPN